MPGSPPAARRRSRRSRIPLGIAGSVPLQPVPLKLPKPTLGERAVLIAARELGVPYRYGGSSPSGFDCSGLVAWVYGRLGVVAPAQRGGTVRATGRPSTRGHLKPGDLVFFHGLGHVGLYIGHGQMIHAPQSGETSRSRLSRRAAARSRAPAASPPRR